MSRQRWTREQDLAVLYLKVEYHGQLNQGHPTVHALADAMDRTVASIWMRKGNCDSLDPSVLGVGLRSAAKLTVDIFGLNTSGTLSGSCQRHGEPTWP